MRNSNKRPTPLESRGGPGWNPGEVEIWEIGHAPPGNIAGKASLCSPPEIGR